MTARQLSYSKTWTEALRISQDEKIFPAVTKVAAEGLLKSLIAKGELFVPSCITPCAFLLEADDLVQRLTSFISQAG